MKRAYKVANHNFIKGGNNQVFIATDGAFNKNSNNVNLMVKYYATKDISISVVGINNERWTEESMQEIARLGNGHYIHIDSYEEAKKVLVEEIKANARRESY